MLQFCNYRKGLQRTRFNGSLFVKFCICEKTTMKNNLLHQNFQCFSIVKFILDDFKTFISTLCNNNDDDCGLFEL
jgi:hypothetical protein